jgi:hypothetical protein
LGAIGDVQLGEDLGHVHTCRAVAVVQRFGELAVGLPFGVATSLPSRPAESAPTRVDAEQNASQAASAPFEVAVAASI